MKCKRVNKKQKYVVINYKNLQSLHYKSALNSNNLVLQPTKWHSSCPKRLYTHQNKAFALWFSSFHKKSPFRDFKIWDGRTTLAAPRVKRQFRVLLHVALPQSQKRSSLRSACAEPIKSLRFFTSRPYLQNKKRIRKIPILFLSGMEGLEPPNAWTKTRCLTTWRHPNIHSTYSIT